MQRNQTGRPAALRRTLQLLLATVAVAALTAAPRPAAAAYDYAYGVNDPSTGDVKDQQESRDGDQVTGYYRLLDADGLTRTVHYAANPRTGFQAHVSRERPTAADLARSGGEAYAAQATSYQQHTRPMSGYRYDTMHPAKAYGAYYAY